MAEAKLEDSLEIGLYRILVLFAAFECVALAGITVYKNRARRAGRMIGMLFLCFGIWLFSFSHYFQSIGHDAAWFWAKLTLGMAIMNAVLYLHAVLAYVEEPPRRSVPVLIAGYAVAFIFELLLVTDRLVVDLRRQAYLDHYPVVQPLLYALLALHILIWPAYALVLQYMKLKQFTGYRRNQLLYFFFAALVVHLTTNAALMPLEYNLALPPIGFFLLPINMGLMGYALSSARLTEFNRAISTVLVHTVALLVVVVLAGATVSLAEIWDPTFLGSGQTLFILVLVAFMAGILSVALPRIIPRAERAVSDRFFRPPVSYQRLLHLFEDQINASITVDELLQGVVDLIAAHLGVHRVAVYVLDDLTGKMTLRASAGEQRTPPKANLPKDSPLLTRLAKSREYILIDQLARQVGPKEYYRLRRALIELDAQLCIPLYLQEDLIGLLGLSEKSSNDMFYSPDLSLLERVATETAFNLRYRRIQEEVLRKNRLAELGTIAAGVAHEIRNPLASIRTFAQLLPERRDDEEFQTEFRQVVLKDVDRISKVIESMLTFTRPSPTSLSDHLASDLAEEALVLFNPRLSGKKIELSKQYLAEARVRVDKQRLLQVLLNLLNNAADALGDTGQITVTVDVRPQAAEQSLNAPDGIALIGVGDSGPGIPPGVRGRLFDPFFTTKHDGTGLGLSISQKIVRDHGGVITVSSVEGKGSTFQVNLPVQSSTPAPVGAPVSVSIP